MKTDSDLRTLPDIDLAEASRHCHLLDPATSSHIFAAFPEAPGAMHRPIQVFGRLDDVADTLKAAQKGGCGVFIAANRMHGTRRRKSEVARIRTVHRDVDQTPVPNLPLTPSLIISTSPDRRQDYIFSETNDPLSSEEAEQINRILAKEYGGDPHASDIARLLRLAGSWHLKGDPFRVRIVAADGRRYKRIELLDAFPKRPSKQSSRAIVAPSPTNHDHYLNGAIRNLVSELAEAKQGHRNGTLNWCAFRLAQLGVGFEECLTRLMPIAIETGLPTTEIESTVKSAWHAGAANYPAGRAP